MEDSLNRNYVNISNKPFQHMIYDQKDRGIFSYKPDSGFWLSLESEDSEYKSEWDEEYGCTFVPNENGKLYATTVRLNPNTYVMSPGMDEDLLQQYQGIIKEKEQLGEILTNSQKRKILTDLVRQYKDNDAEHTICQIDLPEDIDAIEKIFAGFEFGAEYPDSVYKSLASDVKKGIRESFSGMEVTGYALGVDGLGADSGIQEILYRRHAKEPRYDESIAYFDMHSMVIFDTSCLDIVSELEYDYSQQVFFTDEETSDKAAKLEQAIQESRALDEQISELSNRGKDERQS